jgi:hypothetical protein
MSASSKRGFDLVAEFNWNKEEADYTRQVKAYVGRSRLFQVAGPEFAGQVNSGKRMKLVGQRAFGPKRGSIEYYVYAEGDSMNISTFDSREDAIKEFVNRNKPVLEFNWKYHEDLKEAIKNRDFMLWHNAGVR